ncbi:uncharacterized protein L201_007944 [Kwoniella dendrophila CBS 6074]|uniref:Uncharacterized protein n=1 Tax=Kwoniella dendrophila CBS 6074 TaxID=1295534 RepID=A0AAX4K5X9_9TREE
MKNFLFGLFTLILLTTVYSQPTRLEDITPTTTTTITPLKENNDVLYGPEGYLWRSKVFRRSLCSTNAECLKKRLPLLKPSLRKKSLNLHERLQRGNQVLHAPKARRSDTPDSTIGSIQMFDTNGNSIGYLSKIINEYGGYDKTTDESDAVSLSFTPDGNNPFTMTISSSDRSGNFAYLGFVFNDDTSNIGERSSSFAISAGITRIISGPAQASDDGTENTREMYGGQETSVFLLNSDTGEITSKWTNKDGTLHDTVFFYGSGQNYGLGIIAASQDFDEFAKAFDSAEPQIVTLKYVTLTSPPPAEIVN